MNNTDYSRINNEHALRPVLSAAQLLGGEDIEKIITQVKDTLLAPPAHFHTLYQVLFTNFAEFVQGITHSAIGNPTWLEYQMRLASMALGLRHRYSFKKTNPQASRKDQALWDYVVFTGSLLSRIAKVASDYKVVLCNAQGHVTKNWEPLLSSMPLQGTHYKIHAAAPNITELSSESLHVLIARQLMPADGFHWIVGTPAAFHTWLSLVIGHFDTGNPIAELTALAEKQLQKWLLEQAPEEEETAAYTEEELPPLTGKLTDETALGEQFLVWLQDGIREGTISVNQEKSKVHMTADGVFLVYSAVFQDFCRAHAHQHPDWTVVYRDFNYLGLAPLGPDDFIFRKHFKIAEKSMTHVKGVVINDIKTVFGNEPPPPPNPNLEKVTPTVPEQTPAYPTLRFQTLFQSGKKPSI